MNRNPHIVSPGDYAAQLERKQHPLDPNATRSTVSLGDLTGLTRLGVHFVVLKPGDKSSVKHRHVASDEFVVVLEGTATLHLDGEEHTLRSGDFVGFPAGGPSHVIRNDTAADFLYIVGGNRSEFDVVEYPEIRKRAYIYNDRRGRKREVADEDAIEPV